MAGCLAPQGKAAAAAAAAAGIPLTIGRPVVKSAKDAAKAAAVAGVRQRAPSTSGGMPIIGRPVVTPAVPPTKVAKVPGLGDSPQASTQLQQLQQQQAGTPGQSLGAGARLGTSGPQTPGRTMQVRFGLVAGSSWRGRSGKAGGVVLCVHGVCLFGEGV